MGSKQLHLVFVVDTTGSMGSYCTSVGTTVEQIGTIANLITYNPDEPASNQGGVDISIVNYQDYCDKTVVDSTAWGQNWNAVVQKSQSLRPGGGGDEDEAQKTAFNEVLSKLEEQEDDLHNTVVFHYTDAPPHAFVTQQSVGNPQKERDALQGKKPGFDWIDICKACKKQNLKVFTFIREHPYAEQFYMLLGDVIRLPDTDPDTITQASISVLLKLMGQQIDDPYSSDEEYEIPKISMLQYKNALPNLDDLVNEVDCGGYLTKDQDYNTVEEHSLEGNITAIEEIRFDMGRIVKIFRKDAVFQDLVSQCLQKLLVPKNVLAITYNPVFGKLWRECCKLKEDDRFLILADKLSHVVEELGSISSQKREQLKKWVEDSYNYTEENLNRINNVPKDKLSMGFLILDAIPQDLLPSKKDLRSITQFPTPGVLQAAQKILTQLIPTHTLPESVEDVDQDQQRPYLPLGLQDDHLFGMLVHLVYPGMWFTRYAAAIMAILTVHSGNIVLKDRAIEYLTRIKGTWLPKIENLQVMNMELIRLFLRAKEYFTDDEQNYFQSIHKVWRLREAQGAQVTFQVPFVPKKSDIFPDTKIQCTSCKHMRSFTLMYKNKCGICHFYESEDPNFSAYDKVEPEQLDVSNDQSHFRQCRACQGIYAVVNVDYANCEPKCHYCRHAQDAPHVECVVCMNKYIVPDGTKSVPDPFTCPTCEKEPNRNKQEETSSLKIILDENPTLAHVFGKQYEAFKHIFEQISYFKLYVNEDLRELVFGLGMDGKMCPPSNLQPPKILFFQQKQILEPQKLSKEFMDLVRSGKLQEVCNLCFQDCRLLSLGSACGQCDNLVCKGCLQSWYGETSPGSLVLLSRLLCPFCKRRPKTIVLRNYNRLACTIMGNKAPLRLRGDMYYGWCLKCYKVKEAVERSCSAGEIPVLKGFACEECQVSEAINIGDTKKCPGCGAPTIKSSGCNHMTCTICKTDWCYLCANAFAEDQIYGHIESQHAANLIEFD
eukprot:TRINITY_DN12293_c0_g1_i2.p1 TRINITY_DN12293_c0_g1~~TRINITY_DN12293_c0_g1_i2.p1  ORF type:complete len:997 (+),score=162.69 TRINITY_DN12293_c0_g1_i2:64-3054(+)